MVIADINFGEALLLMLEFFLFVAWFWILITIISDLFRDHELSGVAKAVWVFFLIFLPFLTLLIYLIARGNGMAQRNIAMVRERETETQAYIRQVASASPAEEIAKAKALLDAGSITQPEFEALKARALAS